MDLHDGDILIFDLDTVVRKWRVSKIDGNVVKIFEEDGTYKQIPYSYLIEMNERGYIKKEKAVTLW